MAIVTQRKAFKPGKYKGKLLSADFLRQYAEGTNKALAAGVPVPGLEKHAALGADDEKTDQAAATSGAGWLKEVLVDDDGAIGWKIDVPEKIEAGIKDGTIRFTSPEFRQNYRAADGRYEGPIIRHVAFTPLPKAHDQGAITLAMSEEVFQFGEDDYEGPDDKKKPDDKGDAPADPPADPPAEPKNPDSPPVATDKTKVAAAREGMANLGIVLPSDYDFGGIDSSALDVLLTGLNTANKAKADAESKKEDEPEEADVKDSQSMPFSEDDIAEMKPAQQAKARKANQDAIQFSEERITAKRREAVAAVKGQRIPAPLKTALLGLIESTDAVQFSEEGERPTLTVQKAAEMFAAALPPNLQFDEEQVTDSTIPEHASSVEITDAEAEARVDRMFGKQATTSK